MTVSSGMIMIHSAVNLPLVVWLWRQGGHSLRSSRTPASAQQIKKEMEEASHAPAARHFAHRQKHFYILWRFRCKVVLNWTKQNLLSSSSSALWPGSARAHLSKQLLKPHRRTNETFCSVIIAAKPAWVPQGPGPPWTAADWTRPSLCGEVDMEGDGEGFQDQHGCSSKSLTRAERRQLRMYLLAWEAGNHVTTSLSVCPCVCPQTKYCTHKQILFKFSESNHWRHNYN